MVWVDYDDGHAGGYPHECHSGEVLWMTCQGRVKVPTGWTVLKPPRWKMALIWLRLLKPSTAAWKIAT